MYNTDLFSSRANLTIKKRRRGIKQEGICTHLQTATAETKNPHAYIHEKVYRSCIKDKPQRKSFFFAYVAAENPVVGGKQVESSTVHVR